MANFPSHPDRLLHKPNILLFLLIFVLLHSLSAKPCRPLSSFFLQHILHTMSPTVSQEEEEEEKEESPPYLPLASCRRCILSSHCASPVSSITCGQNESGCELDPHCPHPWYIIPLFLAFPAPPSAHKTFIVRENDRELAGI